MVKHSRYPVAGGDCSPGFLFQVEPVDARVRRRCSCARDGCGHRQLRACPPRAASKQQLVFATATRSRSLLCSTRSKNLHRSRSRSRNSRHFRLGMWFAPTLYNASGDRRVMAQEIRAVTAEELFRMPDDGYRYELVAGRLRKMAPPGSLHGVVGMRLATAVSTYVERHRLGLTFLAETGFKLASNPDTVRAPDVAFVTRERIPDSGVPIAYWPGAPDLAVEVMSPDDRRSEIEEKFDEYLRSTADMVRGADRTALDRLSPRTAAAGSRRDRHPGRRRRPAGIHLPARAAVRVRRAVTDSDAPTPAGFQSNFPE